jgi:hypothetical protein
MDTLAGSEGECRAKGIVPGHCVQMGRESTRVVIPGQETPGQPQVELIREGDVIRAIEIVCGCGQRIRLLCNYTQ